MGFNFILPLRIAQGLLAFLVMGLTAYLVDASDGTSSRINFLLFVSLWTLVVVAYLVIAPPRFPAAAHKNAIVAAELLTMLFWFAGFIALAVAISDSYCGRSRSTFCGTAKTAAVFGAFDWLLFSLSTSLAALHCWRTRGSTDGSADPQVKVSTHV